MGKCGNTTNTIRLQNKQTQTNKQTNKQNNLKTKAGEMAQWLRALAALPEDQSSDLSTHTGQLTTQ